MKKVREILFVLGLLAVLTAPFVWLELRPNFEEGTVRVTPSWQHGMDFLSGLAPAVAIAGLVWAVAVIWRKIGSFFVARARDSFEVLNKLVPLDRQNGIQKIVLPAAALVLVGIGFCGSAKWLGLATLMGIYMIQAVGLNIAVGMAGLLVLGYAGFYLLGAYGFAVAQQHWPWAQWWVMLAPVFLLGLGVGWLVGLPCLRLRGDYLAIVTLGFAEGMRELARNLTGVTGGDKGLSIPWSGQFGELFFFNSQQTAYFVVAFFVLATAVAAHRVYQSKIGRAWIAIREDELAAGAMGVPVVRMKLLAFALSAGFAAIAGVLYTAYVGFIDPVSGALEQSILVLAMVILGGLGSIPGALLGSALLFLIPSLLRDYVPQLADYRLFFFGIIMVAVMLYRPQGLLGSRRRQHEMMEVKEEA